MCPGGSKSGIQPQREAPAVIDHKKLESGHGFSFSDQPDLVGLFRDVQDLDTPLTLIVGAGVSMNAGLHSWKELLEYMTKQIRDQELRRMVSQDTADPMRKAELILQFIKKDLPIAADPNELNTKIIRKALYPRNAAGKPGSLAKSIARLVVARERKVRLITTNFDTVLEKALEACFDKDQIRPFALDDYAGWQRWCDAGGIGVLHVHGVVHHPSSGVPVTPRVVLTESQFFRSGSDVRRVIAENMRDANSVFVGLSMTDPNLVGPMYETSVQGSSTRRYVLTVPDQTAGTKDSKEAIRYAIEAADFMARELTLSTIFLKSYSQLNQVLADLSLALVEPDRYELDDSPTTDSLTYENRLTKALDGCYARIGAPGPGQPAPLDQAAVDLHDKLYAALRAPEGPVEVLRRLAGKYGSHEIGEPGGENFALFLWLKCRQNGDRKANYALNLIATSAYVHREMWSIRWWEQPIVRESKIVAVNAVFLGMNVATNLTLPEEMKIWRGIMACPIVMNSTASSKRIKGSPLDTVTVGAITLNSTHHVNKRDPNISSSGRNSHELDSAIMALNSKETDLVYKSITQAASSVLTDQTSV
jgi:hypothetical protein